jgi:predicted nucleic acid-binding protein
MSDVVVDAGLALKWVLAEDFTAEARALLAEWEQHDTHRLVPSWFACEVGNVLVQRVRGGKLTIPQAQLAVRGLLAEVETRDSEPAVTVRALEIADELGVNASYDAQYVARAELQGCELWTADERFWRIANPRFAFVRWIGERAGVT